MAWCFTRDKKLTATIVVLILFAAYVSDQFQAKRVANTTSHIPPSLKNFYAFSSNSQNFELFLERLFPSPGFSWSSSSPPFNIFGPGAVALNFINRFYFDPLNPVQLYGISKFNQMIATAIGILLLLRLAGNRLIKIVFLRMAQYQYAYLGLWFWKNSVLPSVAFFGGYIAWFDYWAPSEVLQVKLFCWVFCFLFLLHYVENRTIPSLAGMSFFFSCISITNQPADIVFSFIFFPFCVLPVILIRQSTIKIVLATATCCFTFLLMCSYPMIVFLAGTLFTVLYWCISVERFHSGINHQYMFPIYLNSCPSSSQWFIKRTGFQIMGYITAYTLYFFGSWSWAGLCTVFVTGVFFRSAFFMWHLNICLTSINSTCSSILKENIGDRFVQLKDVKSHEVLLRLLNYSSHQYAALFIFLLLLSPILKNHGLTHLKEQISVVSIFLFAACMISLIMEMKKGPNCLWRIDLK